MSSKKITIMTRDGNEVEQSKQAVINKALNSYRHRKKPKNIQELSARIDQYFKLCEELDLVPGLEALCAAIGTSRQSYHRWCRNEYCSQEWAEICRTAKQIIIAATEIATAEGTISAPCGIFSLKNFAGWHDARSLEQTDMLQGYGYDREPTESTTALLQAYRDFYAIENKTPDDATLSDLSAEVLNVPDDPITLPEWL